ncbi:MAG: energy transducer TonB, partial [Sphingobacteriales bacterium]
KKFLKKNLNSLKGVKGRVFASFIVEEDGSLTDFKIERGLNKEANNEVLRVLKLSPKWKPARISDKPERTRFNVPFNFE